LPTARRLSGTRYSRNTETFMSVLQNGLRLSGETDELGGREEIDQRAPDVLDTVEIQTPAAVTERRIELAVLAVCATIFILHLAAAVFIPLLLGLLFSYALSPIVDRLHAVHVPRAIGAALLLLTLFGSVGATVGVLQDDASALMESLPDTAQKLRHVLRPQRGPSKNAIDKVQEAAAQIQKAAIDSATTEPGPGVTRVQVERPLFNVKEYLWTGSLGLLALIGQATVVCLVTFFLLVSGDTFRRKLVKIAGPTFTKKRITIEALDEITWQIQRYLLVQVLLSAIIGVATWLAFVWIGLQHAAVWGVLAAAANMIPYFGAIAFMGSTALVAFVQFGTLDMALLVAASSFVIHGVVGNFLAPWMAGRASNMNPVVIFIGMLAFGWLWGVWGLLLGVPILMVLKAVCDRIESLNGIGELLAE
jgi:predicted PurR-regulated permease PerM